MAWLTFENMRCELVLCRAQLRCAWCLHGNAELPQLIVEILHEVVHGGADGAEVMLFELLALAAEHAPNSVRPSNALDLRDAHVIFLRNEEVLLLGADGGGHAVAGVRRRRPARA